MSRYRNPTQAEQLHQNLVRAQHAGRQQNPGFGARGPEVIDRDVGTSFDPQTSPNAMEDRFKVLINPALRDEYQRAAARVGLEFGADSRLSPLIHSEATVISTQTATHPGVPVSLNIDVPQQIMRFYFQDPAFIRRVTATAIAVRLKADGQPEPSFFDGKINPLDYIYAQIQRAGAGQTFSTNPVPLSQMAGDAGHSYFFNLIPVMRDAGTLNLTLSLIPPGSNDTIPPFVDRVGQVSVSFHAERFNPFGV